MKKIENLVQPPKKRLKVVEVDDFTKEAFNVNIGDVYDIQHEAPGEKKYGYLINTKNKKSIVMYASQVELL
jgi:hypothetical protein